MEKQHIWLTYDLSLNGDYEGMYEFLDNYEAVECGDSVAYFEYNYKDDLLADLEAEIEEFVELKSKDRIYVIYRNEEGRSRGKFIKGRRKSAPWEGYAEEDEDDEADNED